MTKLEQAARQALEALEDIFGKGKVDVGAITALREALAEQADEIDWIETNKALAKEIIELKKQLEQEPVAWMVTMENQDGTRKTFPLSGRYKDVRDTCDFGEPVPLYADPIRTKDLTDDEIESIMVEQGDLRTITFARAVIAADREKNK